MRLFVASYLFIVLTSCNQSDVSQLKIEPKGPEINQISNKNLGSRELIEFDINDANTGNDNDIQGKAITYFCTIDSVIDNRVNSPVSCDSVLSDFSFNIYTGEFSWTSGYGATAYEIKILATSETSIDEKIFVLEVEQTIETFSATYRTTASSESITLPLNPAYSYNFTIFWGDGTSSEITAHDDTDKTHTYDDAGDYQIIITGLLESWYMVANPSAAKLISVSSLMNVGLINLNFYDAVNLESIPTELPSTVTNIQYLFVNISNQSYDIADWDTSNVTNMNGAFAVTVNLNIDITNWDTSNVNDMGLIFFNSADMDPNLSNWDFSSVTTMATAFSGSGISTANYSSFLDQCAATATQTNVTLDSPAEYTAAAAVSWNYLDTNLSWTITDAGQE